MAKDTGSSFFSQRSAMATARPAGRLSRAYVRLAPVTRSVIESLAALTNPTTVLLPTSISSPGCNPATAYSNAEWKFFA